KQKSKYKNVVIVMGHTHELDTSERYANLGTWIDHLSGLTPNLVGHPESSLPVLKIDETRKAILYTIHGSEKVKLFEDSSILAVV
ncbi:MAG: hypothetical protein H7256_02715, partial [Bdellovibrio sp.]|nr:hypothetical protein [Bdellovibrio sp.]